MSKITYATKDKEAAAGTPARQWRDEDANEVKTSVNALYDSIPETFDSVNAVKTYAGDAKIINLETSYNNDFDGAGEDVTVHITLKYVSTAISGGGNDMTRIQSTAKTGHWRMIGSSPKIILNHDVGGTGVTSLDTALFTSLTKEDLEVRSLNQDLTFYIQSVTGGEISFSQTIYGQIKIELL